MGLLTEAELRAQLRAEDLESMREYRVQAGTIVTPAARAYLADHKIELKIGGPDTAPPAQTATAPAQAETNGNLPVFEKPARYGSVTGGYYDEKPEHMTALRGMILVPKDHPVIALRGRLDSLEAEITAVQISLEKLRRQELAAELDEVVALVHELLRCEVLDIPLEEKPVLGMTGDEIRERSHTPKKFYGVQHFGASRRDGEVIALLNRLRTISREVELVAFNAWKQAFGPPLREDLLRGLNRLSSLFYVLMLREKAQKGEG